MEMRGAPGVRPYGRIGLLATTLALAFALVASSVANYRGARATVSTLNRGQAQLLEGAMREVFGAMRGQVDSTALHDFIEAHPEFGVRYIALFDEQGRVEVSAGTPARPPRVPDRDALRAADGLLSRAGTRVRSFSMRPVGRTREAATGAAGRGAGRAAGRGGRGRDEPWGLAFNLVEFEPVVANALVARATQSLVVSAVGAGLLALAAVLFWRLSERYARARLQLEEQRRLSVLGEMSAVLAHEIRNPLASLKGNAQLLAEGVPEATRERARADRVVREAVRLESLTTDLLDFARSGPLELRPADPAEVLRGSIAEVAEDGFDVEAAGRPERWTLDARRIRHALVNVLQNARQATPDGRPPRVRVAEERGRLVYEVRDFGPGLPAGSEARVFDPFFTTRTSGTGLGLAVARRVVEMHGGRIHAANHPEGGAVFRIELPAARS